MKKIICLLLSLNITACASMFSGTKDTIHVRSEEPDTKIYIDDIYLGKNSGSIAIPKKGNHSIRVEKEGCEPKTMAMTKAFDGTSLLGILIDFGLVSMLIIDGAATGAIMEHQPKNYVVTPECPANVAVKK